MPPRTESDPEVSVLSEVGKAKDLRPEYADTWRDADGQTIEDPCQYFSETLPSSERLSPQSILPRVLASINDRQAPEDGFSFNVGDEEITNRPGRTLIAPLRHSSQTYHVLLVFTLSPDRSVTPYILEPRAWQTAQDDRQPS